jgi:hypothetical protein
MWGKRNAYRILMGKPEERGDHLGRDIIILKYIANG